ncbi:MAG: hypothetical protein Q9208_000128 [Pyrenodesmia sp. 3 TL-2023]
MNATKLPGSAAVVEHDTKSRSSPLVVQHGSPMNTPVVLNGRAGSLTMPESASLDFDAYTKQLGSHMAYRPEEDEYLSMFTELESLLGAASVVDRHQVRQQPAIDFKDTRLRKISGVIADVDRLLSDTSDGLYQEVEEIIPYDRQLLLSSLVHQNHPKGQLYDVEKQTPAEVLRKHDNRCSDAAWLNTSRIVWLTILLAALVWYSVSLLS